MPSELKHVSGLQHLFRPFKSPFKKKSGLSSDFNAMGAGKMTEQASKTETE